MRTPDVPRPPDSNVVNFGDRLPHGRKLPHNGGDNGGGGNGMDGRIGKLEIEQAVLAERLLAMRGEMGRGFDDVARRFDEVARRFDDVGKKFDDVGRKFDAIERKLDRLPTHWDMAKVVFFVVGALMAAAIWGPRAVALLGNTAP